MPGQICDFSAAEAVRAVIGRSTPSITTSPSSWGNQAKGLWRSTPDFRPVVVRMQNRMLPIRAPNLPWVSRISATWVSVKALMRRLMAEVMAARIRGIVGWSDSWLALDCWCVENQTAGMTTSAGDPQTKLDAEAEAERLRVLRRRRAELLGAIHALEQALAAPIPGGPMAWVQKVSAALLELSGDFRDHVELTEGPDGLYGVVIRSTPRLTHQVE